MTLNNPEYGQRFTGLIVFPLFLFEASKLSTSSQFSYPRIISES